MSGAPFDWTRGDPLAVMTFDTDWVPQFMVDRCLDILAEGGARATFFCTGPYDLRDPESFEAALHPNFLPGSTQGQDPESVMTWLKSVHPGAVGSRSHKYFWYSDIRPLLRRHGMLYDCTQFLPGQSHTGLVDHLGLRRAGTWWSDNLHLMGGLDLTRFDPPGLLTPGLKVLDFHPIHVYMNSPSREWFRDAMAGLPPVPELREADVAARRFDGPGIGTLLELAVRRLRDIQGETWTMAGLVRRELGL